MRSWSRISCVISLVEIMISLAASKTIPFRAASVSQTVNLRYVVLSTFLWLKIKRLAHSVFCIVAFRITTISSCVLSLWRSVPSWEVVLYCRAQLMRWNVSVEIARCLDTYIVIARDDFRGFQMQRSQKVEWPSIAYAYVFVFRIGRFPMYMHF